MSPRATVTTSWIAALALLTLPAISPAQESAPAEQPRTVAPPPDPAAVFPPDTMVYAEIVRPGDQLERLLRILADGGIADPMQMLMQKMQPASQPAAAAPGQSVMSMPLAMMLNPSLINEIKKVDGLAVGLVGFHVEKGPNRRSEQPMFVAALYPGQSDAIRGIIQMLLAMGTKASEAYGAATLHKLGDGPDVSTPCAAVTPRAILVGMPKKLVTDALDRLDKPGPDSLAAQGRFQRAVADKRKDAAMFIYADVDALLRGITAKMTQRDRNDFAKIQQLVGLDALDEATLRYVLTTDGVASELAVSLKPGQNSPVYDLIRTPPADRSLLTFVPEEAIGFCTLSLGDGGDRYDRVLSFINAAASADRPRNAATRPAAEEGIAKAETELGVSLRNDLAANLEGIAVAMLPPDLAKLTAAGGAPNGARETAVKMAFGSGMLLVVKVKDPQRFDQTLAKLADAFARKLADGADARSVVTEEPVEGALIRAYAIPRSPVVPVVARLDRTYVLAIDRATVQAALAAHVGTKPNITTGGPCRNTLESIPASASKIVAVRPDLVVGLLLRTRGAVERRGPSDGVATRPAVPPIPTLQPVTMYTVEDEKGMSLRGDIRDVSRMIATATQFHSAGITGAFAGGPQQASLVSRLSPLGRSSSEGVSKAISIAASEDINDECLSPIDLLLCGEYLLLGGQRERAVAAIEKAIGRGGKDRFYYKSLGWAELWAGHADAAKKAFQAAVKGMGDWSDKTAIEPNIDGWTAAYFLDLITQQEYTDRWQKEGGLAGFPWFYVGQRMEIEGDKDRAVEAYRKSVQLGKQAGAHYVRNWAAYRLGVLTGKVPALAKPSSGSASSSH